MRNLKKITMISTIAALSAGMLFGCGKKDTVYTTFPEDYSIAGVDVSGMTAEEAKAALTDALTDYTVTVTLNGYELEIPGSDLGLAYNESADLDAALIAANTGEAVTSEENVETTETGEATTDEEGDPQSTYGLTSDGASGVSVFTANQADAVKDTLYSYYTTALNEQISVEESEASETTDADTTDATADGETEEELSDAEIALNAANATNTAYISYDSNLQSFVGNDGITCDVLNYDDAIQAVYTAIGNLQTVVETETTAENMEGEPAAGDAEIEAALEEANSYLALDLELYFEHVGLESTTIKLTPDQIAAWLMVGTDGKSIIIDEETLFNDMTTIAGEHDRSSSTTAKFKTTACGDININVKTGGEEVDEQVFFDGILAALQDKKDTTVQAVYNTISEDASGEYVDWGGNYCEVDLTNQMVYVYKDGNLVVSSAVVTGCVANDTKTTRGVFQIFAKDTDRYLNGDGYKTYVNFFMPFCGGIGFHDALWRSVFGGSIYLYSGSHGCINMPYDAVKTLYDNVEIGTHVVVFGGEDTVAGIDQEFEGTKSYTVKEGSKAFKLDTTWGGEPETVTYTSSDTSVVTVDKEGKVTPVGVGTATITIKTSATTRYHEGTFTVKITVKSKDGSTKKKNPTMTLSTPSSYNWDLISNGSAGSVIGTISASTDSGATLTYASSDESVCTVSAKGKIVAKGVGSATITITSPATSKYNAATLKVTVKITSNLKTNTITCNEISTYDFTNNGAGPHALNASANGATLTYSVTGPATVDGNGNITFTGTGTVTVTIKAAANGTYKEATKTFTITVS